MIWGQTGGIPLILQVRKIRQQREQLDSPRTTIHGEGMRDKGMRTGEAGE